MKNILSIAADLLDIASDKASNADRCFKKNNNVKIVLNKKLSKTKLFTVTLGKQI